jgi:hypothetical protein
MKAIGRLLKIISYIVYAIFGLWGFILSLSIINYAAGFWGVVIGFAFLPLTFVAAPWYALVQWGTWYPLTVNYGGIAIASVIYGLGALFYRE